VDRTGFNPVIFYSFNTLYTMACKSLVLVMLCAAAVVLAAEARELLVDRTVSNCKEYGIVNKERVCTRCENDFVLVPGGRDCNRVSAGCKDPGFEGGKQVCKACKDDFILVPGTRDCTRRAVGRH